MKAVANGFVEFTEKLLKAGADTEKEDDVSKEFKRFHPSTFFVIVVKLCVLCSVWQDGAELRCLWRAHSGGGCIANSRRCHRPQRPGITLFLYNILVRVKYRRKAICPYSGYRHLFLFFKPFCSKGAPRSWRLR